jgi:cytochrome c-type biogenesis protein CcmH
MNDRRAFLRRLSALSVVPWLQSPQSPTDPSEAGSLRDPGAAGRARERVNPEDNDAQVMAIEKRLQCTCGCTLDIYTCRTTDFTCTYSPDLHKEVLALRSEGKGAEEIVAAFVARYGEKVLMAPKPVGFNWAGYLVPGALLLLVGGTLFAFLKRRSAARQVLAAAAPPPIATEASPEELARLAQALKESEQ